MQKYPVESISVIGETELYLDEFSADDYILRVKHSDGWIENLSLADYLTDDDKEILQQSGLHTLTVSYGGQSCEWSIELNLRTFDDAVLEDTSFAADGTAKYLQVTGIPDDTEVIWENNGQTEVGEYLVTATLKKEYYEDKTLTAYLYIRQAEYIITYVLGVEDAQNPNPETYSFGEGLTLASAENDVLEFLGWYSDSDFTQEVTEISAEDYGDKILYARWQSVFEYSNGEITGFTDYGQEQCDSGELTDIVIPYEIEGQKITSIGASAFSGCSKLVSITISDGITSIGEKAFYNCTSLTSITIPDSVTSIGDYVFYGCSSLTSVNLGNGVTSIGSYAFSGCTSLTSITIGNSVTSIGSYAFPGCTSLTSITIPDRVTSIGWFAFSSCTSLTRVTIGNSITSIGSSAFSGCTSLKGVFITDLTAWCNISFVGSYANPLCYAGSLYLYNELVTELVIPDEVTEINSLAFSSCTSLTSVAIGNSVTSIGSSAFSGCTSLESVTIPNSVTSIGSSAFCDCTSLTSIVIPDSVTSIGSGAFSGCTSLTSITIGNSVTSIGSGTFSGCTSLTEIYYNATDCEDLSDKNYVFYNAGKNSDGITVTIGANVTKIPAYLFNPYGSNSSSSPNIVSVVFEEGSICSSIGNYAFHHCSSLTSIDIPDDVTSIGDYAFTGCTSLESVTIPNSVTSIGRYVFFACSSLTSITIPNSVTSIGSYAFYKCTSLISITIPDSVTSIGSYAFFDCASLAGVYITDITAWCNISFDDAYANPIYCAGNLYLNGKLVTEFVIPDEVTSINDSAFYGCTSLKTVTIGSRVTSIGSYTFYGCSKLTSVTIPGSVSSIGSYAFYGCTLLKTVTIGSGVTSIGNYAFYNCTSLTEIYYNATACNDLSSNNCIFSNAGKNGDGITVTIGANVKKIPNCLFYPYTISAYVPNIVSVVFEEGSICSSIGDYAFFHCSSLTSIDILDSVTSIGSYAFYGCTKLTNVTIPGSVISIGSYAFGDCYALTSVTIGNGVISIGSYAFNYCISLTSITIPDSVTSIGSYAFYNCSSLTSVKFDNTSGWWRSSSSTATSGTSISSSSLPNTSTAATYLTSTYASYYWKRS